MFLEPWDVLGRKTAPLLVSIIPSGVRVARPASQNVWQSGVLTGGPFLIREQSKYTAVCKTTGRWPAPKSSSSCQTPERKGYV